MYVKMVLNAKDKPSPAISEAFLPLFMHMEHEDFKTLVFPSCIKMLKRNPEIVMESIAELLKSVNLDLSKYATEYLSVVLPQARHADEGRRIRASDIIGCLSQKSSDPDIQLSMFSAIKNIIGGWFFVIFFLKIYFIMPSHSYAVKIIVGGCLACYHQIKICLHNTFQFLIMS